MENQKEKNTLESTADDKFLKILKGIAVAVLFVVLLASLLFGIVAFGMMITDFHIIGVILWIMFSIPYFICSVLLSAMRKKAFWGWMRVSLLSYGFCALLALMISLFVLTKDNANGMGLVFFGAGIGILAAIVMIVGISKKKKLLIGIPGGIFVGYLLLAFCAANDFPYFLRHIPGEDFLDIMVAALLASCVSGVVLLVAFLQITTAVYSRREKHNVFADSDLMLMQNFSPYKLAGYYLLKGKFHKVLEFEPDDAPGKMQVFVSAEMTEEYRKENPQVSKIADFCNAEGRSKPATVEDVIRHVKIDPPFISEAGKRVKKQIDAIKKWGFTILYAPLTAVWVFGFWKLLMGIHNGKDSQSLAAIMFGGTIVAVLILYFACREMFEAAQKHHVARITDSKVILLGSTAELMDHLQYDDSHLSPEDIKKALRAYAIGQYTATVSSEVPETSFATASIMTTVSAMEMARIMAARKTSSDSGCGGCSSCGGCGGCGGSGGCGGCGD